ncbi:hemagglutinin repeat-containing protein [Campylobacter concisus]|uniref:Filamentous hemagglutinin N-terminal domain-containing protein n=1 Tax=Campylobacter concisus TaxID=199 RepID=A0A7S9S9F9_9BACT|nr:hemagglutinin repeat-containing protein [Campylobacter concisus]QPI05994.1 filamentous hemagglutinin N-terminal domain-containing protein [Campylobacter concisus]
MLKNNQISNAQKPSLLTIGLNFYVSLSLLLGTMPALANEPSIIADPGASNRPDILKAPNETLIINITNPDSKGVSINEYSRFNTPTTGTILNNSNKNIDTKIAGQIDANYRLTKEASLIINKVNSAEKSSLKGNLEVAGSRADVVIANPNGISVDGLNMINSRSLTLTTGNINKLSPKEIELISDKSIDIVGDGLNDKSSDYTNVISNAINLNSNIHANELNIIGEKAVTSSKDRLYNDVKAKNQENSFSLDSSALGGMYANKIKLVGTSNGVGVNNNGLVIANNNIEISLDGDIVNAGAIASNKEAKIEAKTITNKDEALIAVKENLNIKAETLVNTSSQIYAKDINVEAKKLVNNSSSQARVEKSSFAKNLALKQSGENRFKLEEVNLKEIKAKIEAKFKKLGKELNEEELNAEILKEAISKDSTLYALNLHKDSYLYGTSTKVFHNLRLDIDKNEVVLDTSKAKDREVLKRIYYSINKEILNEEDKANFIPGSIVASNDINLKTDELLNDKSFIYAGNDLVLDSKDITNVALNLTRDGRSFNEFKWKQQEWKGKMGKVTGKKKWVTKGGKSTNFNFSYTDVGLPAVFAAGNNIVGSTQNFSSYALNDDIKLANVDLDKFSEPIFNSPIIKNLNRRVKNQGYYYSLDSINSAYIANILDGLYEARNESISKFKNEAKDKNVKASALVMANNIELDAKGNIILAGSVAADNINLNSKNLNLNHLELNSKDLNLKADAANINSSEISAKNINVNANNISLDKESSQFSKASNLKADESLNLNAKENLNITGGGLEADKINLSADNININAKEFAYSHSAKEKGVEFKQNIQTLNSANLDAKDINLNSKSNTQISSSNLRATNKLNIEAGNDIYVVGANTNESTETKEKSKGFFSKKESHLMAINQKVISSNLNAGDMSLKAGGNLALVSSNLNANNINLNADENVIVDANHNVEATQSFTKSSRFSLKPTSLYESNLHLLEKGDKMAVASNLNANENININASNISLKGANLNSQKDINLNANSIEITNSNDESYRNEVSKKSKIGLISIGEHLKNIKDDLKRKLNVIKETKARTKETSLKIPVAKASLDQKSSKENWVNANSSNLNANGDINLNAKDDINIVGSNLNANEAINLTSQNSNIKHSTNLYAKDTSSKEATGTLSITAQNEYAQIVPAALALKEAIAQLKRVKKEYDNYKKEKSKLEASLSDIKQRYRNKEVGIDYSDIEEVSEILEEYRDEEKYFKENILLATENVNAKNLALITQMAAALASSGTYGFSVGVRADLATTKQESSLKQTSSNKSSLNAKHININSTKDISITGSDLASKEDMSLNSNNLNINSSEDSLKYKSNTKSLTTGFGFTFYGANSSSLELGTNSLKQSEQSLTNNNSHLYSAKDMNINTANDATIKGANLRADERLNLKVGNNLSLESTRDIKDASSKSRGINLSISYSGATNAKNFASGDRSLSSVGASISKSNSNTKIKQTNLSSITANELNVEVGKNTHLKGSLLVAGEYDKDNTFIDNHNLNLKTNTLSYENLSNTSYNKGSSLSIGANYSVGKKDDSKASQSGQGKSDSSYSGLKSINYSNHRNLSYTLSKNMATIGSGNIEIADKENSDDLTRLNRDTTKLTKDLVNTSISSNVDASMDLRVLTKSGQKEIAKEIVDTSTIIDAIKQISTTDRANIFSFFKEVSKQYKVLNGVREEVANSPELQAFLSSSTTTEAQRKEAMTLITLAVMKNLGYLPNDLKAIYTDERGYNGENIKGFTSLQTGASYINFKNITNMKDLVKTITHENQRSMDIQDHRDINKNRDDDTKYASNFSDFATRYFSHALWLNDKGFSKTPLTTAVTTSIINNNREFAKLDKNLGANRMLTNNEYNLAMELAYRYSKENNIPYAQSINLFMLAAKTNVDRSQKEAFEHVVSTLESADESEVPGYSIVFDRDKIDEAYNILVTTAKERNLYFLDNYQDDIQHYPLYTATKEQYEDKHWDSDRIMGIGDTSDILIPFAKPAIGAAKQLSSALYSSSKNVIKAPFVEMQARVNEKLLANTPKGGTLGSDGILRHNGKEYVARNFDLTGNKVIYEQVINKKGTGNFKTTNDKGYFITVRKPKISAPESSSSTLLKDMTRDIKFYDSSKTTGIVAGGIISAGVDTYSQYTKNNNSFNNYDPLSAIMNITVGLYTGGASYMLSAITRGAAGNAASEIYSQATDLSKNMDGERVILKGIIGAGMGSATGIAGKIGEKIPRGRDGNYKTILENTAGAAMGLMQAEVDNRQ